MAEMISVKRVGILNWESIVETPTCLYYFYGYTKSGVERQAHTQIEMENKLHESAGTTPA